MRSLRELEVLVNDDIDDPPHIEISVEPAVNRDEFAEFGDPDDQTLKTVGREHAGVLGRLGLALTPWIDHERLAHGCGQKGMSQLYGEDPAWCDACYIGTVGLLEPQDEEFYQPVLFFIVPVERREPWLARINSALADIAEGQT